jgi:hypothetical protein
MKPRPPADVHRVLMPIEMPIEMLFDLVIDTLGAARTRR